MYRYLMYYISGSGKPSYTDDWSEFECHMESIGFRILEGPLTKADGNCGVDGKFTLILPSWTQLPIIILAILQQAESDMFEKDDLHFFR